MRVPRAEGDLRAVRPARRGIGARLVEPLRDGTAECARRGVPPGCCTWAGRTSPRGVVEDVAEAARRTDHDRELADFGQTAVEIARLLPRRSRGPRRADDEPAPFGPYDAIYLPPGDLHAYLRGGGIEIMANSDNVLRGGLTPKHIDVDELLAVLDFTAELPDPDPLSSREVRVSSRTRRRPRSSPSGGSIRPGALDVGCPRGLRSGRAGGGRLGSAGDAADGTIDLGRGQSAFVYADERSTYDGQGVLFVGAPGLR